MAEAADSPTGKFVLASDFDRMRRRLIARRLLDRNEYLRQRAFALTLVPATLRSLEVMRQLGKRAKFFRDLADALTRNEPLAYFNRLGQDK